MNLTVNVSLKIEFNSHQNASSKAQADVPLPDVRLLNIIDAKISSCKRINTMRGYQCFRRWIISNFDASISSRDINQDLILRMKTILEADPKKSNSQKQAYFNWLKGCLSFAKSSAAISDLPPLLYPIFKPTNRMPRFLTDVELKRIAKLWNQIMKKPECFIREEIEALRFFLISLFCQGLAPVDMAKLRRSDFLCIRLDNGKKAYVAFISRTKTSRELRIVLPEQVESWLRIRIGEGLKINDDHLFPCLSQNGAYSNQSKRGYKIANWFYLQSNRLNNLFITHNILQFKRRITFYFARHAFCDLLYNLDVSANLIRKLIGHAPGVLEKHYLRPLSIEEQAGLSEKILQRLIED